jgi:hypothetical protein
MINLVSDWKIEGRFKKYASNRRQEWQTGKLKPGSKGLCHGGGVPQLLNYACKVERFTTPI